MNTEDIVDDICYLIEELYNSSFDGEEVTAEDKKRLLIVKDMLITIAG